LARDVDGFGGRGLTGGSLAGHVAVMNDRSTLPLLLLVLASACEPEASADATIAFHVRIVDGLATTPLEGVEVCAAEHPEVECAVSDENGEVDLELPANSELMLRCEGAEHGPAYMTWTIGDEDIDAGSFGLIDEVRTGLLLGLSGAQAWPDQGAITVNVYEDLVARDTRVADVTVKVSPAGGGPVYISEAKLPDPSLTATTTGGPAVAFDLEGDVTVSIQHPTRTCTAGFGWETGSPTELRSRIFPGGLSNVTFVCPP
jgi:hypothetical protein